MTILIIILVPLIWLLLGAAAAIREYYSTLKQFYIKFGVDARVDKECKWMMNIYKSIFAPLFVLGGPITLILILFMQRDGIQCWYFKIPKN